MLFNSIQFIFFFVIVTALYFSVPYRYRWFLLLTVSCYFYMAFVPVYILILFGTIVIDYFAGIIIENAQGKKRKIFLVISLISNIGVLAVFKYYNFLNENLTVLLGGFKMENPIPMLSILLPIGLSFHTFQAMSYTIEVYRGNQRAEKHFGIYALYVMFYPQLVAGPIERPQNLLHQFREKHSFDYKRVTEGLKLMAWGMFKKVVIADRLSVMVDRVYDHPQNYEGIPLILATLFFAFQIYCDFSGYSDIAIGSAQVMGFKLMKNFNRPYLSKNIAEFWSRWHISLSTWFKDYLYIPLGGNRVVKWRMYYNLLLVFLVSGLWHGAKWTFIAWGALHGIYLVSGMMTKNIREKINTATGLHRFLFISKFIQASITFALVCFAWIFFRASTITDAMYVVNHLFTGLTKNFQSILSNVDQQRAEILYLGQDINIFFLTFVLIGILLCVHFWQRGKNMREFISQKPNWYRWSLYFTCLLFIIYLGVFTSKQQFIYFQF